MSTRLLRAALALAVLPLAAITGSRPAAAYTEPALKIKVGQQIVISAKSPVGMGKGQFLFDMRPGDCDSDFGSGPWCDGYPVTIDAPADVVATHELLFTAVLEWAPGTRVDNCPQIGNCGSNEMGMQIWEEPPNTRVTDPGLVGVGECAAIAPDTPGYDELCAPGTEIDDPSADGNSFLGTPDSPIALAVVGAGKRPLYIGVGNFTGVNDYKLTITVQDFTDQKLPDASAIDDLPIDDFSDGGPTGVPDETPPLDRLPEPAPIVAPPSASPVTSAPVADVDPNTLLPGAGGAELSLDQAAGGGAVLSDSELAAAIADKALKPLPVPGDVSGAVVAIWLALLPLAGFGWFFVLLAKRRRREEEA